MATKVQFPVSIALGKNLKSLEKEDRKNGDIALEKVGAFGISISSKNCRMRYEESTDFQREVVKNYEDNLPEETINQLPKFEISLRRKIKKRIMLAQSNKPSDLTSHDKQILEELRLNLRTQPNRANDSTAVLEAIADPKVRESRFYYEPLHKLPSQSKKITNAKSKSKQDFVRLVNKNSDINFLNTMVPPSQHHFNTPITNHSHHVPSVKSRSNASRANFPRIINQIPNVENVQSTKTDHQHYSLSPSGYSEQEADIHPELLEATKHKARYLPSISLKIRSHDAKYNQSKTRTSLQKTSTSQGKRLNDKARSKNTYTKPDTSGSKIKTHHNTINQSQPLSNLRTTATGKSHLISPMNKMGMIVEYSRMLQDGKINYDQYIKKLTVLSLHKIDLANSGLRQYHIVRDQGVKARLARVDIYPHGGTDDSTRADNKTFKNGAASLYPESKRPRTNKDGSMRVSRISIGENYMTSLYDPSDMDRMYDAMNIKSDAMFGDIVRAGTDVDRYRYVHRPADKHTYNWSHVPHTAAVAKRLYGYHGVVEEHPPVRDIHTDYGGKLPESREMKKRLNFSYPSYDVVVDGKARGHYSDVAVISTNTQYVPPINEHGNSTDPDYLAITLDSPRFNAAPIKEKSRVVTSSLSVHDVTMPQEIATLTGHYRPPRKMFSNLAGQQFEPWTKDASSSPDKGNFDNLNIGSISYRKPIRKATDNFGKEGVDGVIQSHLSRIFMNLSKLNNKKHAAQIIGVKSKIKPETKLENLVISKKITPTQASPYLAPSSESISQEPIKILSEKPYVEPETSSSKALLLSVASTAPQNSPPPTAHVLQRREDEATSGGSDDLSVFETASVLRVNIPSGGEVLTERNQSQEYEDDFAGLKQRKKIEVIIAALPVESQMSETESIVAS